ncbi:hypothetical protein AIOL_001130 [Candidatus Rhodobacter oscarellae]|uniref:Uncharacterized protein n=1 Tax=Candidatus Rhodobacter oscarellae TaxID=1675527 RepID=A0A0J9GRS7_9RHOB|nr:hypothetical protein [Candidatus Rhodobacter lobularis]KMW56178.1 hypothetical protein AIOL_001130 [Candidatus Rhodobacter lobularis]
MPHSQARNAVKGGWDNHHEEFVKFVSYEVIKTGGDISMTKGGPVPGYSATVAISAIHREHGHGDH